jgi:ligand-binding sensor domain-containing protein
MVATANGLVMFDSSAERRQVIGRQEGLIANHVTDLALTPEGLVAATPAGITFVDRLGMRSLYAFHGLVNNHVYALGVKDGRVLAGTLGGLSVLESGVIKANYNMSNSSLRQNWITAIAPAGRDWFLGTYGGGVAQWTAAGGFITFTAIPGQVEVNPNAMLVTDRHVLAGTLSHGLLIYDRVSQRWWSRVNGLPSKNVTALAVRGASIYVGTDNGLLRIEESVL